MRIVNVHERRSSGDPGALIDGLASPADRLWPHDRWPRMRFDRGLVAGARGGHGPIRYEVAEHLPGRLARFRFTAPRGLEGEHRFERDGSMLRHVLEGRATGKMLVAWPLVFRPLHDALIEDALDRAEAAVGGQPVAQRRWSPWVRLLRRALAPSRRRRS